MRIISAINPTTGAAHLRCRLDSDHSKSDIHPEFCRMAGPDFTNPANYRLAARRTACAELAGERSPLKQARIDVRYTPPIAAPTNQDRLSLARAADGFGDADNHRWTHNAVRPLQLPRCTIRPTSLRRSQNRSRGSDLGSRTLFINNDGRPTNSAL